MLNLSDKELDRLSREAAERVEVEHDPTSWNKLEIRLDKELGRPSPLPRLPGPRSPFLYFPAAIVLIGITILLIKTSTHKSNFTQKNNTSLTAPAKTTQTPAPGATADNNAKAGKPVDAPAKSAASSETTVLAGDSREALTPLSNSQTKNKQAIVANENEVTRDGSAAKSNRPVSEKNIQEKNTSRHNDSRTYNTGALKNQWMRTKKNTVIHSNGKTGNSKDQAYATKTNHDNSLPENVGRTATNERVGNAVDKSGNSRLNNVTAVVTKGMLQPLDHNHGAGVNDALLKRLKTNSAAVKQAIVTPGKKNQGRGLNTNRSLQFGFLFSPDFSEVRYNYNNRVGSNIGLTVSYQLGKNFSVNSGFVFTKKHYDAIGFDFHLPANCGIDQHDLDFAISTSHMYEIPLNIRYDVNKSGNNILFLSAGLSSYIMKKENFEFFLHDYSMGYRHRLTATYKTNDFNWFSVLNLSAGFETKISNSFSIQAEPYVKIPVTGVGFGSVNLSSYGLNISLKYAPVLRKTRK